MARQRGRYDCVIHAHTHTNSINDRLILRMASLWVPEAIEKYEELTIINWNIWNLNAFNFVFGEANFCITWKLNHFFKNVNDFTWKILWNFFHLINFIENYQWSLHAIKVWVCYTSTNWEKTGGEIDAFNLYFEINEENYSSTWLLLPSILQIR